MIFIYKWKAYGHLCYGVNIVLELKMLPLGVQQLPLVQYPTKVQFCTQSTSKGYILVHLVLLYLSKGGIFF